MHGYKLCRSQSVYVRVGVFRPLAGRPEQRQPAQQFRGLIMGIHALLIHNPHSTWRRLETIQPTEHDDGVLSVC